MRKLLALVLSAGPVLLGLGSLPANAQATRTWVSGVGDDANPCSRTAPCKTFAGAISKTFIGGTINCLDPGGFGTITIVKSITLDCHEVFASILASGTNGVNINIAAGNANDPHRTVHLRGLRINGIGASGSVGTRTGIRGINLLNAAAVYIDDVIVENFTQQGIHVAPATSLDLFIQHSTFSDNTSGGVLINPPAGAGVRGTLEHVSILRNGGTGLSVQKTTAGSALIALDHSEVVRNTANGVQANGANADVLLNDNAVTHNGVGLDAINGGGILSSGNNAVHLNGTNGAPTGSIPLL